MSLPFSVDDKQLYNRNHTKVSICGIGKERRIKIITQKAQRKKGYELDYNYKSENEEILASYQVR